MENERKKNGDNVNIEQDDLILPPLSDFNKKSNDVNPNPYDNNESAFINRSPRTTISFDTSHDDARDAAPRRRTRMYANPEVSPNEEKSSYFRRRSSKNDDISSISINASGFSFERKRLYINIIEILKIAGKIALIALVVFGIIWGYNQLLVDEISINGSVKYSSEQLLSMSGIQNGAFILSYTQTKISSKLSGIPDIKVLDIERTFPNKLEVKVADRDICAALEMSNGMYTLISVDGYVIDSGNMNADGIITIHGLSDHSYAIGSYINDGEITAAEASVVSLLEGINSTSLAKVITAIDLSNTSCIKLEIGDEFIIVLGDCIEAHSNLSTASKAYEYFRVEYPQGGIINVFSDSTIVDFTPNKSDAIDLDSIEDDRVG